MTLKSQAKLWGSLPNGLFSPNVWGSGGTVLQNAHVSLGFVVMDVVWEDRSFCRFSAFLRLHESLGFRDSEQYIDFRVDILRIAQRVTLGSHLIRRQLGPLKRLEWLIDSSSAVSRHEVVSGQGRPDCSSENKPLVLEGLLSHPTVPTALGCL